MPKTKKTPYDQLTDHSKTIATFSSIHSLLEWDQETYMPQEAIEFRSVQTEAMASYVHKLRTSDRLTHLLNQLIDLDSGNILDASLSEPQKAALREWRRDHLRAIKLPSTFVKSFANTCSKAIHAWSGAKKTSNFTAFAPHLEKIVHLCQKKAEHLGYIEHPYDALLDTYEPGMKVSQLVPLFNRLKPALTSLLKTITSKPKANTAFLHGHFTSAKQIEFAHLLLKAMGFDPNTSRLDQSAHPFCTSIHPKDTRMTTRLHPSNLMPNIFSVLHEGGHGLYNADLPVEHFGTPLGEQISLGIDESQSRWWETRIGRSVAFWKHFYPLLQNHIQDPFASISLQEFHRAINLVEPSLIRTDADEVTYPLHVILRFELEKGLIEGSITVKEIPDLWNGKMQELIGIAPEKHSEGCLQDIPWSMGGIGYFPTYVLGNLYAAQFFNVFEKAHPDWQDRVAAGELAFIREWLSQNIHQYGRQYTPDELCRRISGQPLSEAPFVQYLEQKYITTA